MDCSRVLAELVGKYVMYAGQSCMTTRLIKEHGLRFVPAVSGLEDMLFMLDYLPYSDYLLICDTSTYIYRVGIFYGYIIHLHKRFPQRIRRFFQLSGKSMPI